jgi:hypothetical protein
MKRQALIWKWAIWYAFLVALLVIVLAAAMVTAPGSRFVVVALGVFVIAGLGIPGPLIALLLKRRSQEFAQHATVSAGVPSEVRVPSALDANLFARLDAAHLIPAVLKSPIGYPTHLLINGTRDSLRFVFEDSAVDTVIAWNDVERISGKYVWRWFPVRRIPGTEIEIRTNAGLISFFFSVPRAYPGGPERIEQELEALRRNHAGATN